jgi:phage terminase Nu1 subunit (DNA packaging protein)
MELARTDPDLASWVQAELSRRDWSSNDKAEVANFFDVAMETIDLWQRKGMPYVSGGKGVRGHYDLRECARWLHKQRGPVQEDQEDVDYRYRQEKAKIAELHRKKLEGGVVDKQAWQDCLNRVVGLIRNATEGWHRKYGNEFVDEMNELCDRLVSEIDRLGETKTA